MPNEALRGEEKPIWNCFTTLKVKVDSGSLEIMPVHWDPKAHIFKFWILETCLVWLLASVNKFWCIYIYMRLLKNNMKYRKIELV